MSAGPNTPRMTSWVPHRARQPPAHHRTQRPPSLPPSSGVYRKAAYSPYPSTPDTGRAAYKVCAAGSVHRGRRFSPFTWNRASPTTAAAAAASRRKNSSPVRASRPAFPQLIQRAIRTSTGRKNQSAPSLSPAAIILWADRRSRRASNSSIHMI